MFSALVSGGAGPAALCACCHSINCGPQAAGVTLRQKKDNEFKISFKWFFLRFWGWDGLVFRYFSAYLSVYVALEAERKEQELGPGHQAEKSLFLAMIVGIVQLYLLFKLHSDIQPV